MYEYIIELIYTLVFVDYCGRGGAQIKVMHTEI